MKLKPLNIAVLVFTILISISILGGSAIWFILGFGDRLVINGVATQYQTIQKFEIDASWSSYGAHGKSTTKVGDYLVAFVVNHKEK